MDDHRRRAQAILDSGTNLPAGEDLAAQIIKNIDRRRQMSENDRMENPIVKGGQGRTDQDAADDGDIIQTILWVAIALTCALAALHFAGEVMS